MPAQRKRRKRFVNHSSKPGIINVSDSTLRDLRMNKDRRLQPGRGFKNRQKARGIEILIARATAKHRADKSQLGHTAFKLNRCRGGCRCGQRCEAPEAGWI